MKDQFQDLLDIEDVLGIMVISPDGKIVYKQFNPNMSEGPADPDMSSFIHALNNATEAEFHYEKRMIYISKARRGFILAIMERSAPIALVRLSCGVIVHYLNKKNTTKGLGRFFTKRASDD